MIASRVNETVKRPKVENDAKAIRGRYGESGYIYVTVRVVRVFSETPGLVRITFEIDEGEQFRVGHVRVRGNTRTKDKVVRRALSLFPPADLWDLTEAKEAERRLVDTRMFSSARIYPTGSQPGVRDAVIDVVESEKAGDFLVGVGVTSDSGVVGNIVLELKNFDLFDWPRSAAEFFKFRSFVGAGQTLRLELQPGTEVTRARIDFVEPYLFDKPIRYDHSIFLFERERDGYTEQRVGTTVSFGKRFEHGLLRFWSSELSFKLEDVDVKDVDLFAARDIKDVKGSSTLTSVKGTLVRDRTDNRFLPTTGDRFRVAYEQYGALGGDYAFGELTSGYSRFFTLHTDLRERKHVLEMRAEAGSILGEAPVFERFYAGGNGSIRGFDYRGIGPREGLDNNNVGGDYLILLGTEYSFPMIGENLRGLLFLDSGTAGGGRFRAGLGVGIRFTLDILGPVPFEFDLAAPVSSDDEDDTQVFSFMVGKIF
jgi:outer membrane protein assembly factor BamA